MRLFSFVFGSVVQCAVANAQGFKHPVLPFDYPPLPAQVQVDSAAVPEGWHMLQIAYGDFDRDGLQDFAIAVEFNDSVPHLRPDSMVSDAQPRILAIYRRTFAGPFALLEQSNTFILRADEGGPYGLDLDMRFERDTLYVGFQFLRGHADYGFLFREGHFTCLRQKNAEVLGPGTFDYWEMDLDKNTALHHEGPVSQDALDVDERLAIPPHPPLTLERLQMPFRTNLGPDLNL